jgi:hypothetical protein
VETNQTLITFAPPVKLQAQRKYRVGLSTRMSQLRYRYYQRRGWIKGEYYIKPQEPAWLEWLHCLVSPTHADNTWLRLTQEAEDKAILVIKRITVGLAIAAALLWGFNLGVRYAYHHTKAQQLQIQIQGVRQA